MMAGLLFSQGCSSTRCSRCRTQWWRILQVPKIEAARSARTNLIGEIGAVLPPTISGTLRDHYNAWHPAVYLDAVLILASFVCLLFVHERARATFDMRRGVSAGA